jgi:hypothetical protein
VICEACAQAADDGKQGEEAHREAGCKGDCPCMHREGTFEEMINVERLEENK